MFATLDERLEAARAARFAGRARERARLAAALAAPEPAVCFLHGPGGIGKTTVLDRFVADARAAGYAPIRIDARGIGQLEAIASAVAGAPGRLVLVLDTFEVVAHAEPWLRDQLLPSLPGAPIVVIAGREPPSVAWRTDPAWHGTLAAIAIEPLDERDSADLLARRGVAAGAHAALHRVAHGHPLALALLAEIAAQRGVEAWQPELTPDVVATLVDRFVRDVPGPDHRRALDACAIARVTTEHTLRLLVGDQAPALFDWLRGLAFVQSDADGVFPHDLARDVIERELLARDPGAIAEMRRRLRADLIDRLARATTEAARQRLAYDLMYGARGGRAVDGFFTFRSAAAEPARDGDAEPIAALLAAHEGAEAAALVRYWFARQRHAFVVFRAPGGGLAGVAVILDLAGFSDADRAADPAIAAAARHAEATAPLAAGERVVYTRFFGTAGAWQEISPIQDAIQVRSIARWLAAYPLAYTFIATRRADVWTRQFDALEMYASERAAFTTDGVAQTVFVHDWRSATPLEVLFPTRETPRLDDAAIASAVAAALRDFTRAGALEASPLRGLAIVRAAGDPTADTIRAVLREVITELARHPRDAKAAAVLEATYVRPAPTQEAAAERLDLPIGTYRRHLKRGVERVAELICARERAAHA